MLALALSLSLSIFTAPLGAEQQQVLSWFIYGLSGLLVIIGFLAGVLALFGLRRYGRKGILVRAICGILLSFVLVVFAVPSLLATSASVQKGAQDFIIDAALSKGVEAVNKQAPMMVDEETRLIGAETRPDRSFVYRYTIVSTTKATFPPDALERIRQGILDSYKTNPQVQPFHDLGVTVIYQYSDPAGESLGEVVITPGDVK